jgi:hypothetical protein
MRCPEVPAPLRVCRGPLPPLIHLTKNDTDGEVIFVGTRMLTNLFFRPGPKVNCVYFRLRHQYQK